MQEPKPPVMPVELVVQPETKVVVLAQKIFCLDEHIKDIKEFNYQYRRYNLIDGCTFHNFDYENNFFSLQEILKASQGLSPELIRISGERDREVSFVIASIVYESPYSEEELTELKKKNLAARAKYEKEYAAYQAELKKFEAAMLKKHIKELQERLEKMKK